MLHYTTSPTVLQRSTAIADQAAAHRVLDNLVSNAIKYSPLGSNVWVSVECLCGAEHRAEDGAEDRAENRAENRAEHRSAESLPLQTSLSSVVRVLVRDEGPGISEQDKQRLFGKFARLSARPTGKESSTGLGLSIVKSLVEAMHGRVWCESAPESGTLGATFIVELPAADA